MYSDSSFCSGSLGLSLKDLCWAICITPLSSVKSVLSLSFTAMPLSKSLSATFSAILSISDSVIAAGGVLISCEHPSLTLFASEIAQAIIFA